jgi:hypothetical protein
MYAAMAGSSIIVYVSGETVCERFEGAGSVSLDETNRWPSRGPMQLLCLGQATSNSE